MTGYKRPHEVAVTIPLLPVSMHMLLMDELRRSITALDACGLWIRADQIRELRAELERRSCVVPVIGPASHNADCQAYRALYAERNGDAGSPPDCICHKDLESRIRETCNVIQAVTEQPVHATSVGRPPYGRQSTATG